MHSIQSQSFRNGQKVQHNITKRVGSINYIDGHWASVRYTVNELPQLVPLSSLNLVGITCDSAELSCH